MWWWHDICLKLQFNEWSRFIWNVCMFLPEYRTLYPRIFIFSHRRAKLQPNPLAGTCVAPKNTSVFILVSGETSWSAAQVGVIYLTALTTRTVALSQDNSTVNALKIFSWNLQTIRKKLHGAEAIFRSYGCFLTKISYTFFCCCEFQDTLACSQNRLLVTFMPRWFQAIFFSTSAFAKLRKASSSLSVCPSFRMG